MKQPKQFSTVKQQNTPVPKINGEEIKVTDTTFQRNK